MKNLFILLAMLLSASCIQLPNAGNSNNAQRIKAKVIRITCASTVIQVLDSAHYNLGETWTKQGTAETYEHVAVVSNKCEFPTTLKEGDEFYFKQIGKDDAANDCAVCMMYDFPPSKGIYLQAVN
ncbi:MAG: hypothetical protein U0X41_09795 [Chitinophagales bacterium]